MEHNPLFSFNSGLEITYSDLKTFKDGREYITIYFKRPNDTKTGFDSADIDFPYSDFQHVIGFSPDELKALQEHVDRSGATAFNFAKEDAEINEKEDRVASSIEVEQLTERLNAKYEKAFLKMKN